MLTMCHEISYLILRNSCETSATVVFSFCIGTRMPTQTGERVQITCGASETLWIALGPKPELGLAFLMPPSCHQLEPIICYLFSTLGRRGSCAVQHRATSPFRMSI